MSSFRVDLKKVVDDSYDIEIGYNLADKLIEDIKAGLVGKIKKFAVVTDSNVKDLYAENICKLLKDSGYTANLITIEAGEKSKTRQTKEFVEDTMLALEYRRDCCIIAVGGGVVTDLAEFLEKYKGQRILLFGFTFMIWQHFYKELERLANDGIKFDLSNGILVHGGGWKKLVSEAVSPEEFHARLNKVCGIEHIQDYYGMVEKTGCI